MTNKEEKKQKREKIEIVIEKDVDKKEMRLCSRLTTCKWS